MKKYNGLKQTLNNVISILFTKRYNIIEPMESYVKLIVKLIKKYKYLLNIIGI